MGSRKSCVFLSSWFDAIEKLPKKMQGDAYRTILMYALRGVEEGEQMSLMLLAMVRPVIDANTIKYENGCKGGRPRKEENNQEVTKPKPNQNQEITKPKPRNNQTKTNIIYDRCNIINPSLSKSLSSSGEKEFDEEKNGGLTTAEREKILEVFYFERNVVNAREEAAKFINHYEANGWCRGNSTKPVKNKVALARSWKVEREQKKYPEELRKFLHDVYHLAQKNKHPAHLLFDTGDHGFTEEGYTLQLGNKETMMLIDMYATTVERGFKLFYLLKK